MERKTYYMILGVPRTESDRGPSTGGKEHQNVVGMQ